jgi:NitT/TauT family transport system substrate-binding protein
MYRFSPPRPADAARASALRETHRSHRRRAPSLPTAAAPGVLSRRGFLAATAGLLGAAALARPARAQATLKVGYVPLLVAGPLFVAHDRGYFRAAGLDLEMVRFNAAAEMVVALGTGELAAGYGGISPGLFNAWGRGVRTVLVADGGRFMPGYGYARVMVRPDLAGEIRTVGDLRGRRVGMSVVGSVTDYFMRVLLEQNGLTVDDVEAVRLASADVNAALAGRTLDVAGIAEPFAAQAEQLGIARDWLYADQIVPGLQVAGLFLSDQASRDRAQAGALVAGWLRGVRDFLPGQTSDPGVIEVLNRWTGVQPDIIRRVVPAYMDPNGATDLDDVRRQQAFWLRHGVIDRASPIEERVDPSFAEAAVQLLGRV